MLQPLRLRPLAAGSVALAAGLALAACGGDPTLRDLPPDIAQARPSISLEEANFVLDARQRGVTISAESVDDDIETGTTTCWALKNGGVQLKDIAVDDAGKPLGNTGEALRTKRLMAAGVTAFCPDFGSQVDQLDLP